MHIGCLRGKIDGGTHGETNAGARKMPKSVQFPGRHGRQASQQVSQLGRAGKVKEELCLRMTPNVPGHLLASSTDLTLSSCSYSTIEQSAQCSRNIIML